MAPDKVEEKLKKALEIFTQCAAGRTLLQSDTNERSISHHLANAMAQGFAGWDIDVEYNRLGIDLTKTMDLPQRSQPSSADTEARTVFPDIIVHRRTEADNLLVVEIKKSSNPFPKERIFDRVKLREYLQQLRYRNAFYVEVQTDDSIDVPFLCERVTKQYKPPFLDA